MDSPLPTLVPIFMASVTPGPSTLLAMDHGLRFGVRRTLPTALGNVAATALQGLVCLVVLSLMEQGSAWLFGVVRWGGALYLVYLGLRMLLPSPGRPALVSAAGSDTHAGERFRLAFLITLGNPAAYLFFAALFPVFLGSLSGLALLAFGLMLPTLGITFTCMMLYARFGRSLVRFLTTPRRARLFRVALGLAFLGMGSWMILGR